MSDNTEVVDGIDSTDGADNADSADGIDSSDSADGADGTDGTDGTDGVDRTGPVGPVGRGEERIKSIALMRARKILYWSRIHRVVLDDDILRELISDGTWRVLRTKKMRLYEWLVREIGVSVERAVALTCAAINKGQEDEKLYT